VLGAAGLCAVVPDGNCKAPSKEMSIKSGVVTFVVAIIYECTYVPLPVNFNIVSAPSVVTVGLPVVVPE